MVNLNESQQLCGGVDALYTQFEGCDVCICVGE